MHDVRLHVGVIEGCGDHLRDGIRRHPGAPVVVGEPPDTPVESDPPCRSQYSGLPHGTAQPLAHVTRPLHRLRVADHHRARRGAKTRGEAERDGVGQSRPARDRDPGGDLGVEQPGAVDVDCVPLALARCETSAAAEKSGTSPPSVAWVISRTTAAERGLWSSPGRSSADNASGSISGPRVARLPRTRYRLARAGQQVIIGSRRADRAKATAAKLGHGIRGVGNATTDTVGELFLTQASRTPMGADDICQRARFVGHTGTSVTT